MINLDQGDDGGTSGWIGFERDEGRRELEIYHNTAVLFQDAEGDTDSDSTTPDSGVEAATRPQEVEDEPDTNKNDATAYPPRYNWKRKTLVAFIMIMGIPAVAAGFLFTFSKMTRSPRKDGLKSDFFAVHDSAVSAMMPNVYANLLDVNNRPTKQESYIPLLWEIPGDGGCVERILTKCIGLVAAGGAIGDARQTEADGKPLEVFKVHGSHFVNVHASSLTGIDRAAQLNLADSGVVDVVYAPLIYEAAPIFTETHPGRMFAMLQHPVHRVMSLYRISHQLVPMFSNATLKEFLDRPEDLYYNSNWMTRELSGGIEGEVNEEHFQIARTVLRKKCLVGLTSDLDVSLQRFYDYFGWNTESDQFRHCEGRVIGEEGLDLGSSDLAAKNKTPEWELIAQRNHFDIRLFEFATMLYAEQDEIAGSNDTIEVTTDESPSDPVVHTDEIAGGNDTIEVTVDESPSDPEGYTKYFGTAEWVWMACFGAAMFFVLFALVSVRC